jgi:hypothetical protein
MLIAILVFATEEQRGWFTGAGDSATERSAGT